MRDVAVELKGLRLYGMASAWGDLTTQGGLASLDSSRWLIEHLLQAESTDRAMRSINYQMKSARFPIHRDLAGFDFTQSCVDQRLISELADLNFTEGAHNVVLIGGPGTGKRIWLPRWVFREYPGMGGGCAFTPRWIWSMRWNRRRPQASQADWHCH